MRRIFVVILSIIMALAFGACSKAKDPNEIIEVKFDVELYNGFYATIFNEEHYKRTFEKYGFLDYEIVEDGVAVFKIKRSDYEAFDSLMKEGRKKIFDKSIADEKYSAIDDVSYNDELTEFIIKVDKAEYEKQGTLYESTKSLIVDFKNNVCIYLMFAEDEFEESVILVKDSDSGEVLKTVHCTEGFRAAVTQALSVPHCP